MIGYGLIDLSKVILSRNPQMKCLYMSGYTADVISRHGVLSPDTHFIRKPFYKKDLAFKVREVLDGTKDRFRQSSEMN